MTSREKPATWLTASGLARRHRTNQWTPSVDDAQRSAQAQQIQAQHRGWLVMWSRWHRAFTAFSCFSPVPLVVDRASADDLVNEMVRLELHYSPTRIDDLPAFIVPQYHYSI